MNRENIGEVNRLIKEIEKLENKIGNWKSSVRFTESNNSIVAKDGKLEESKNLYVYIDLSLFSVIKALNLDIYARQLEELKEQLLNLK